MRSWVHWGQPATVWTIWRYRVRPSCTYLLPAWSWRGRSRTVRSDPVYSAAGCLRWRGHSQSHAWQHDDRGNGWTLSSHQQLIKQKTKITLKQCSRKCQKNLIDIHHTKLALFYEMYKKSQKRTLIVAHLLLELSNTFLFLR